MGGEVGRGVYVIVSSCPLLFTGVKNINKRYTFQSAEVWLWLFWLSACCENWQGLEEGRLKLIPDKLSDCK